MRNSSFIKTSLTKVNRKCFCQRIDEIVTQKTSYATLNRALKRFHNNKGELLVVLDRHETPLYTNGSETDIRDYV